MNQEPVFVLQADYDSLERAVGRIFAEFPLSWRRKKVLVKPNVIGAFPPERHVTTHPALVRAVMHHLLGEGAEVTLGDNTGSRAYGENERCFRRAGLLGDLAPCYRNIGQESRFVGIGNSMITGGGVRISQRILDADLVISLPKFKTHQLTTISGAIKNSFGFVAGADKAQAHRSARDGGQFAEILVDIFQIRPPDLVIMDAVVGMEGEGPAGRQLRPDCRRLLASTNAVHVDAVMAEMMGLDPRRIPMLAAAGRRSLGETAMEKIAVIGDFTRLPRFKKPSSYFRPFLFRSKNFLYRRVVLGGGTRLRADRKACTSCASCREICPALPKAIEMAEENGRAFPVFDERKCLACYCCMEICPAQAIEKRLTLARKIFARFS